jgi:glycerophosphoryl diester phosphodiesterase
MSNAPWPYPKWIAHRGAGKLAPENTLAAFRLGASHGYRCFECDVKLSSDEAPFLLHDTDLERTTNGHGVAGTQPWASLASLDAGAWHSKAYAGEPLPTLARIASFIRSQGFTINLEIKPTPGVEARTGAVVAEAAARLWHGDTTPPLLSSFKAEALAAARTAVPTLPRALLLDTLWSGWEDTVQALGCVAIVCNHKRLDAALMATMTQLVPHVLVYTVNDAVDAQRVETLGVSSIITDAVDRFKP